LSLRACQVSKYIDRGRRDWQRQGRPHVERNARARNCIMLSYRQIMRPPVLTLWVLFAVRVVAAQQATLGAPSESLSEKKCGIEGAVVRASTGEQLRKAVVTLYRTETNELRSTSTDAGGRFSFGDIPAGPYKLFAERTGYVRAAYQRHARGNGEAADVITVQPGNELRGITIKLTPTGVISGKVSDENGDPVSGATVQALRRSYVNGQRQLNPIGGVTTNDIGEYRVAGLAPGSYYVVVTYTTGYGEATPEENAYEPVYYPSANDSARAAPVGVGPGNEVSGINFGLTPIRAVRVGGRLVKSLPEHGGGIGVNLIRTEASTETSFQNYPVNFTGGDTFEIRGVTPGSYVLFAQWFATYQDGSPTTRQYNGRTRVEVGNSDLDGVEVVVGPGNDVKGRIRAEGGAKPDFTGVQIGLQSRESFSVNTQPVPVQSDGTFVLPNVPDGTYTLNLMPLPQGFYLKSAYLGTQDVLESEFTVSSQQSNGDLDVVLSAAGGELDGVVLNQQQPAAGATVVLVPDVNRGNLRHFYPETGSDQHGRFSLRSVAPGEYIAFASEDVESDEWHDPEFAARYHDRGKPISVGEGSRLSTQLESITVNETDQ
jgi:hypothetical protein